MLDCVQLLRLTPQEILWDLQRHRHLPLRGVIYSGAVLSGAKVHKFGRRQEDCPLGTFLNPDLLRCDDALIWQSHP